MQTETMSFPEPVWLRDIPAGPDRASAQAAWAIALAAVYASRKCTLGGLAEAIGTSSNRLAIAKCRGDCPASIAEAIEDRLGADLFPRTLFRPAAA